MMLSQRQLFKVAELAFLQLADKVARLAFSQLADVPSFIPHQFQFNEENSIFWYLPLIKVLR